MPKRATVIIAAKAGDCTGGSRHTGPQFLRPQRGRKRRKTRKRVEKRRQKNERSARNHARSRCGFLSPAPSSRRREWAPPPLGPEGAGAAAALNRDSGLNRAGRTNWPPPTQLSPPNGAAALLWADLAAPKDTINCFQPPWSPADLCVT